MRTDKITKDQSTSPLMKKMVQFRRIDSVLTFEEFKYMPKNKELHNPQRVADPKNQKS